MTPSRKQFRAWGAQGGAARDGEAKRRGGKEHYSKLGKRSAVKRKWRDKLPPEARPMVLDQRVDDATPGGMSLKGPPRRRRSATAR